MKNIRPLALILTVLVLSASWACKKDPGPDNQSITAGDYAKGDSIRVPLIAWGADLITINANGRSARTVKGSFFDQQKLNIELFREDDFSKQTEMFIRGDIMYLRGTMGMINMASEKLNASEQTRPVIIFQHSWSAGGDALVVKPGINSVTDLKGKTVALQSNGPHVDYFLKLVKDAGISPRDVFIAWTKDLVGIQGDTPSSLLAKGNVDAAFVIIPDALALTSNGAVGTGAEDSVKGARILLSTKTANRIISDVYAVRKDYYADRKDEVLRFVKALLKSEEEVRDVLRDRKSASYSSLLSAGGKLLLDDAGALADVEGMYRDAEIAAFTGNARFLADAKFPRNCMNLSNEIQTSLLALGLINRRSSILVADWDYDELKSGLRYAGEVSISKFNPEKAVHVAEKLSRRKDSSLFSFEIFFQPNQNTFSAAQYREEFDRVIDFASTYGGALITVEGHSDPMGYLRKEKSGGDEIMLKKIRQAAKNLSYSRAGSVRDEIARYAQSRGITLDKNQFTIIGYGIESPKYPVPGTKEEWAQNMRVQFKIIQVEAEEEVFRPL